MSALIHHRRKSNPDEWYLSYDSGSGTDACWLRFTNTSPYYSNSAYNLTVGDILYTSRRGRAVAPDGFYGDVVTESWFEVSGGLGEITDTVSCPVALYPYVHVLTTGADGSEACAVDPGDGLPYYSADATIITAPNTKLYLDQNGIGDEIPSGFYSDGSNWYEYVYGTGASNSGSC